MVISDLVKMLHRLPADMEVDGAFIDALISKSIQKRSNLSVFESLGNAKKEPDAEDVLSHLRRIAGI